MIIQKSSPSRVEIQLVVDKAKRFRNGKNHGGLDAMLPILWCFPQIHHAVHGTRYCSSSTFLGHGTVLQIATVFD